MVELHNFLVQLVVKVSRHNRILFVQAVLLDELADEAGTCWYLTLGSGHQELQDMIVRLLVLLTVILKNHEVPNQRNDTWEI